LKEILLSNNQDFYYYSGLFLLESIFFEDKVDKIKKENRRIDLIG
jgi:hypothetical protein